jgi:tetratricopeptide (TPR) repeat protein/energy-coupling factor transporter ATP-binding protein EcfA2
MTPVNNDNPDNHAAAGAGRFSSLGALRTAHNDLLGRRDNGQPSGEFLADVATFIDRAQPTGALLDDDDERWASQSILDYWTNLLYRAGGRPPEGTLADFDPAVAPRLNDSEVPYLGLNAFREENSEYFFGRRRLIEEMVEHLRENRLLAVLGPSGSGKSSLALAGVLPALKSGALEGSENWSYYGPIVPGSDPLASLSKPFRPANAGPDWIERQADSLRQDPLHLLRLVDQSGDSPAVIVIDQFEELFTLCNDKQTRQAFTDNLIHLIQSQGTMRAVILTMRSDFESYVAQLPEFQKLFQQSQSRVTPLGAAELREAIEKPAEMVGLKAEKVGLKFESGLVDQLINDILGEPAGLPLLQFTLFKLWEKRERNRVTWDAYRRLGGGRLALARSADELFNSLIKENQDTARRILLRMVRPGDGLEVTSNRVRRETLYQIGDPNERIDAVLRRLIDAKLVRLTKGETPADDQVEVAHEALVRNWPTLVDWLEEERAELVIRRRYEIKAAEWARLGRGESGLLDEAQLIEAEHWMAGPSAVAIGYSEDLPELINRSRDRIEETRREREAALGREREQSERLSEALAHLRRQARTLRIMIVIIAGIALLALWQTVVAVSARSIAVKEANEAKEARALAEKQAGIAKHNEDQANRARAEADEQRQRVEAQRLIAEDQTRLAEKQQLRAEAQTKLAEAQKEIAKESAEDAQEQRRRAEEQTELAKDRLADLQKAQEKDLLIRDGVADYLRGDSKTAQEKFNRWLSLYQKEFGSESEGWAFTILATMYGRFGEYARAKESYDRALEIYKKRLGPEHSEVIAILDDIGDLYLKQANYQEAEKFYQDALAIREKTLKPDNPALATSYEKLATVYEIQRSPDASHYRRIAQYLRPETGSGELEEARRLGELAWGYFSARKFLQTQTLFQKVLEIREKDLGTDHYDTLYTRRDLARYYFDRGEYAEAEKQYRRVLDILRESPNAESRMIVDTLFNLAEIKEKQREDAAAEKLYRDALDTREKQSVPNDVDILSTLYRLTNFYLQRGRYEDAQAIYKRSIGVIEKADEADSRNIVSVLSNLAGLYFSHRKYAEAEMYYLKSIEIMKRNGNNGNSISSSLEALGRLYLTQNKLADAEKVYMELLDIYVADLSSQSAQQSLAQVVKIFAGQKRNGEARNLLERVRAKMESRLLKGRKSELVVFLRGVAETFYDLRDYAEAEKLCRQALAIQGATVKPNDMSAKYELGVTLQGLAYTLEGQEKYDEAEAMFKRALTLNEKPGAARDPDYADASYRLARFYLNRSRYDDAQPLYGQAIESFREFFNQTTGKTTGRYYGGYYDRFYLYSLLDLAEIHSQRAKYADAESLYKQVLARWEQDIKSDMSKEMLDMYAYFADGYAKMLKGANRPAEAVKMEELAKAIQSKIQNREQ